jgi:hypothetical protein
MCLAARGLSSYAGRQSKLSNLSAMYYVMSAFATFLATCTPRHHQNIQRRLLSPLFFSRVAINLVAFMQMNSLVASLVDSQLELKFGLLYPQWFFSACGTFLFV